MMHRPAAALALAAALLVPTASAQDGCYPAYAPGASYGADDWVSSPADVTATEACTFGSADPDCAKGSCSCTGAGTDDDPETCVDCTKDVTTTETFNWKCISDAWCPNSGYVPDGTYSDLAWLREEEPCVGTADAPTVPPPAAWSGGGCPAAYVAQTDYAAGEVVAACNEDYCGVYACKDAPLNLHCGQAGYAPGDGLSWDQAWTFEGSCSGTLAPTSSPSLDPADFIGGCAEPWVLGNSYAEGDRASDGTFVYECLAWPNSEHCGQSGYEPSIDSQTVAWKDAWTVVGWCEGTIAPTSSPSYVALADMGGCPPEWEQRTAENPYEEGDTVSANGIVFACKGWPMGDHCGQSGYSPLLEGRVAWKDAWTTVGYCSGSIAPTGAPTFDPANSIGACPPEWEAGDNVKYEMDDMVSVVVSEAPLRKVAFKCKGWPESGHCGQYSPLHPTGGSLGWDYAGSCDGSMGPTASPTFDVLVVDSDGCPPAYDPARTDYMDEEEVSLTVSDDPARTIVYRCRSWPNTGYCSQSGFAPDTQYGYMAWTLLGACEGTIAPTPSPTVYDNSGGQCNYEQCREVTSTVACAYPTDWPTCLRETCTCSGAGTEDDPEVCTGCTKEVTETVCTTQPVNNYGADPILSEIYGGDVVRVGRKRYKCKELTGVYLWCRQDAYQPGLNDQFWPEAWVEDGECP